MARFDPDIKTTSDPSYLGLSKESDKPKEDRTMERLFSGLADVGGGLITTVDNANKTAIKEEVYGAVDAIRDDSGVKAGVASPDPLNLDRSKLTGDKDPLNLNGASTEGNPGGGAGVNLPPGVKPVGESVDRLTQAFRDGRISPTYYWQRVEGEVRRIRARYPGYREEIDGFVSGIVGTTPANALRASIQSDFDKAQQKVEASKNSDQHFVDQNAKYDPAGAKAVLDGKMQVSEFRRRVYENEGEEKSRQSERERIALSNDRNNLNVDQAVGTLHKELSSAVNGVLEQTMTGVGGGEEGFMAIIKKSAASGKGLSPQEKEVVMNGMAELKRQVAFKFDGILNEELSKGSGHTYASIIKDKTKIDGVREVQLGRIDALEKQLTDGQVGLLARDANIVSAIKTDAVRRLYNQDDIWKTFAAVREMGGDTLVNNAWSKIETAFPEKLTKALIGLTLSQTLSSGGSVTKEIEALDRGKNASGPVLRGIFETHTGTLKDALKDKSTNPKILENLVTGLYEGNVLSRFAASDRMKVYGMMAAPEITDGLKKANPALFEKYSAWMQKAVPSLLEVQGQTIRELSSQPSFTVKFDKGQFAVQQEPVKGDRFGLPSYVGMHKAQGALNDINRGLSLVKPVLEASGVPYDQYVNQVIRGMSTSAKTPGEKEFFQKLLEGVKSGETQNVPQGGDGKKASLSLKDNSSMSNFIGQAEGADYDTLYGGWKGPQMKPTETTVAEVLEHQRANRKAGADSSPVGKGQFMPDTIRSLVADGVISLGDKLTGPTQEKMIEALIERRKKTAMNADGTVDKEKLADELAKEWASLPTKSGKSHYEGDGLNKSTVPRKKLLAMIDDIL